MKVDLAVDIKIRSIIEVEDSPTNNAIRKNIENGGKIVRDEDRQAVIAEIADMFCVKPENVHITHEDVRVLSEEE